MQALGITLLVFGVIMLASSGMNASQAPSVAYLIGSYMPGGILLALGLWLSQRKKSGERSRPNGRN